MTTIAFTIWDYLYAGGMIFLIVVLGSMFALDVFKTNRPPGIDETTIPTSAIRPHPMNRRLTGSEEERELIMRQLCSPGWRRPIEINGRPCPYCRDIAPAHERWCPMVEADV